jgi:2-polyprenyl-3-methyl-5-hydroxy-6-metoxy-1,4-benzoquinol methylase
MTENKKSNHEKYGKDYYFGGTKSNYVVYHDRPYNKELLDYLLKYIKKGRLLEIGCAFGYFLKYASNCFETYGMDISNYAIKQAKQISPKSHLKIGNVEKDLVGFIGKNKFDVIVALDVLEHLDKPQRIINTIFKSLNEGGIFIFRVPNLSGIDKKFFYLIGKPEKWQGNKDKTHISLYSIKKWKQLAEKSNFKVMLLSCIPTTFLKEFTAKRIKKLFFVPRFLSFTNKSLTFFCIKQAPLKNNCTNIKQNYRK